MTNVETCPPRASDDQATPGRSPGQPAWWETRRYAAALIALSVIPLLLPAIPPLVDVPGHIGRLHLMLGGSPFLDRFYSAGTWPIGNLGVDIVVIPFLGPLLGAEIATRIVVTLIPPATVAAMLWVAREAHGRLPPTAAFAVPLAYSQPFSFGFINYSVGVALAIASLSMWIRLGRHERLRTRALVMVGSGLITFMAHVSAWGLLGLMAFASEVARRRVRGDSWRGAIPQTIVQCLPLALPFVLLLLWRSEAGGDTLRWFDWGQKIFFLVTIFRDRWFAFDFACLFIVLALPIYARTRLGLRWSGPLVGAATMMLLAFLGLPETLFGSHFADMRVVPMLFILILLSIGIRSDTPHRLARRLAVLALGFAVIRLAIVSASLHLAADRHSQLLAALDHVPMHSRLVALVEQDEARWELPRDNHLPSMAIVRRDSFINGQWQVKGGTSLIIHHPAAGRFESDDSQYVFAAPDPRSADRALAEIPLGAFDALWLIDSAAKPDPRYWTRIHQAPGSTVYLRADQAGRRAIQP